MVGTTLAETVDKECRQIYNPGSRRAVGDADAVYIKSESAASKHDAHSLQSRPCRGAGPGHAEVPALAMPRCRPQPCRGAGPSHAEVPAPAMPRYFQVPR